ncbi:MAG: CRISPR-associated helicase Cas3' [Candidatus Cloacimonadaceae bacterium]|nr:CRISPR-associated helicase Cas3' [Candidatus Cloacimonadaceae bacterium]MDP3115105.1 CRISPR-associated helicase Cas3' [Candidatus Cloacimonadaceae bacterium]
MRYLAKPDKTLYDHSMEALSMLGRLISFMPHVLARDDLPLLEAMVLFHDIGKINDAFQKHMNVLSGRDISSEPELQENRGEDIRHELLSAAIFMFMYPQALAEIVCIYSHHKDIGFNTFNSARFASPSYDDIAPMILLSELHNILNDDNLAPSLPQKLSYIKQAEKIYQIFISIMQAITSEPLDRSAYLRRKGLLYLSDWFASGNVDPQPYFKYPCIDIEFLAHALSQKKNGQLIKWYEYQKTCALSSTSMLVVAPTGTGKTEAALLWAGTKDGRIVYLLPTRVTTNAIFKRMRQVFSESRVALVHSSALLHQKETDKSYTSRDYLLAKTFCYPVSVCTIDQVLISGFNIGYWEIKELNLINARIIIDEIHTYDAYTMGLIIACLTGLHQSGCLFFIMSATMPQYLIGLLQETIPSLTLLQAHDFAGKARNSFLCLPDTDLIMDLVKQHLSQNRKILIVVNTIDGATSLYQTLCHELQPTMDDVGANSLCYHARHIQKHRTVKEWMIERFSRSKSPCLLVSTQVVEVSLDIDFDVLISENAPIDALIQRVGRVNRRGVKTESCVYVFEHGPPSLFVYNGSILQRSYAVLQKIHGSRPSESALSELVDEVYRDFDIRSDPDFLDGVNAYAEAQKLCANICDYGEDNDIHNAVTRRISTMKTPIIPMKYYAKLKNKSRWQKIRHQVDVPLYVVKNLLHGNKLTDNEGFLYCDLPYSNETGLMLTSTDPACLAL